MTSDPRDTVLIVDDSPDDIAVLDRILKETYRVKAATSAEAALAIARGDQPPDLILLDIMMPGADGFEVCRALKQDPATAGIPVIFVTAKEDESDESMGFEAGAVDYVVKPVNPHLVRARVDVHLALRRAQQDLEAQNETLLENARLREEVEAIGRHDLKNPLMIVMSVPQIVLSDAGLSEGNRKLLRMVDEAGRRMLDMINRTIDLYKMERGTYALKAVPVDALPIITQITAALGALLQAKSLACRVTVNGKDAKADQRFMLRGEDLLIYSLLANLLKNAAEASPPGGQISVSLTEAEPCLVAIHNRGAIPQSIRPRFFQKFATAGKAGGTGLGAYSAKLTTLTLSGTVGMETSEEAGTTITIQLPRA